MVVRKRQAPAAPAGPGVMPAELERFDPLAWPGRRLEWQRARAAWAEAHGAHLWDYLNPFWRTHGHTGRSCSVDPPDPRCSQPA